MSTMEKVKRLAKAHKVYVVISICILISSHMAISAQPEAFGAEPNPTGNPIGGGEGYSNLILKANAQYLVSDNASLLNALGEAKPGEVIYVEDAAEIDMTGQQEVTIPGGVTLSSGRGFNGSKGALIYTNDTLFTSSGEEKVYPILFLAGGEGVRITGLRLSGPDPEIRYADYEYSSAIGIQSSYPRLEIDNCELSAWSNSAVYLDNGTSGAYIHHNYIHHCQRECRGYGICLGLGRVDCLIEANLFDYCRHCIAGTGTVGNGYEARNNIILEHANSHSFDMHGGADRQDGTDIAGSWINIYHNTFKATNVPAVDIRGKPQCGAFIHHNWFYHNDSSFAVRQENAFGNMSIYENLYGITNGTLNSILKQRGLKELGKEWFKDIPITRRAMPLCSFLAKYMTK